MRLQDLKDYVRDNPQERVLLHCPHCGGDYSASPEDYFISAPETVLKCCEHPLMLARKITTYEIVREG